MRRIITGLALGALVVGVAVVFAVGGAASQESASRPSMTGADADREARRVLAAATAAYRGVAGLRDRVRLEVRVAEEAQEKTEIEYEFGSGTDASVHLPGMTATAVGDRVFVTLDDVEGKYLEVPLQDDLGRTLVQLVGGEASLVPVSFDLRAGRDADACVAAMGMGALRDPRISGYRLVTDDAGSSMHEITFESTNGSGRARLDAKSHLIRDISFEATFPTRAGESRVNAHARFEPKTSMAVADSANPPGAGRIRFDSAGRKAVSSLERLRQIGDGDVAPGFEMITLDGDAVSLEELRGSVVVLDFWATWCGPCRMALPLLDEFAEWAATSGHPITVYAVNTFENGPSAEAITSTAGKFWKSKGFAVPSLLDTDGSVARAYGISSIPSTLVIAPDGVVAKVHLGFDPQMVANLKRDALAAMQ